jgi:exonuclease SbcC
MIIKKITIHNFGKHTNLELLLSDGLNIIYGKNETGKSTIQSFIKAMFYGIDSRSRSLRDNERKKFLPWNEGKMSGELTFIGTDGLPYVIHREFGKTKKNDVVEIYNEVTGVKNNLLSINDPGRQLFSAGIETFENTVFIGQLGCMVSSGNDKDGEIMKKLSNLTQSGNEDISYRNVYDAMNSASSEIISKVGKRGKLNDLERKVNELTEEKQTASIAFEEASEDRLELKKLIGINNGTVNRIKLVEIEKSTVLDNELLKDYHELSAYVTNINELETTLSLINKSLSIGDVIISREYLNEISETYRKYIAIAEKNNELSTKYTLAKKAFVELEANVAKMLVYDSIDDIKLLDYINKSKLLTEKIKEIETKFSHLLSLRNELEEQRSLMGNLSRMEDITPEFEAEIFDKENELRILKAGTTTAHEISNLELKIESTNNSNNNMKLFLFIGIALFVSCVVLAVLKNPLVLVGALIGLVLMIWAIISISKSKNKLKQYTMELEGSRINPNEGKIELIFSWLNEIFCDHNTKDSNDFQKTLSKYKIKSLQLNSLNSKVQALDSLLSVDDLNTLVDEKNTIDSYLEYIKVMTGKENVESVISAKKEYENLLNKIINQKEFCDDLEKEFSNIGTRFNDIHTSLMTKSITIIDFWKIANSNKADFSIDYIPNICKDLDKLLIKKDSMQNSIDAAKQTLNALLKGHSLAEIKQECETMMSEGKYYDSSAIFRSIKDIDDELSGLNEDHVALEKDIKKLENHISLIMANKRPISEIEEELMDIYELQNKYKNHHSSLTVAMDVLKESFEEMQMNFGPVLNDSASNVLSELTNGKYGDIRVSQQYEVKISENSGAPLRESDYFSNGTLDQIYFSLRMAISDLVFDNNVPIFLDDPFVQYDDERLSLATAYLNKRALTSQIVLFTCHKKIIDLETPKGNNVIMI